MSTTNNLLNKNLLSISFFPFHTPLSTKTPPPSCLYTPPLLQAPSPKFPTQHPSIIIHPFTIFSPSSPPLPLIIHPLYSSTSSIPPPPLPHPLSLTTHYPSPPTISHHPPSFTTHHRRGVVRKG